MRHPAGHYFHAYNRGNGRQPIFAQDVNYVYLLTLIKRYLPVYPVTLLAYCLMPNHYHFLFRLEEDDQLSPFIQRVFNAYTQGFNKQQGHKGTLFEGRVKIKWVDKESYLIHLVRYIHCNPVKAGLVKHPAEWEFSNYREWTGCRNGTLFDPDFVKMYFPNRRAFEDFTLSDVSDEVSMQVNKYLFE